MFPVWHALNTYFPAGTVHINQHFGSQFNMNVSELAKRLVYMICSPRATVGLTMSSWSIAALHLVFHGSLLSRGQQGGRQQRDPLRRQGHRPAAGPQPGRHGRHGDPEHERVPELLQGGPVRGEGRGWRGTPHHPPPISQYTPQMSKMSFNIEDIVTFLIFTKTFWFFLHTFYW